ncbi:flagellar hook-length control protein FliK [Methylobacterium sp. J-030]|uniref:flagellar hook-length control protein FliK n=1 Tax=Methylobacterium sp. J-030 TaxID=2836627 RepID=UPI001FB98E8D|nr:flagellar hook-length control protein FliK [Methylobacterium sp. J-030]MCJ2069841.1 flagellar hook-length control protein FliK [Methylobacterium sp. J-030]
MTAIPATLQNPAPQPDREVMPSQSEADGSNPPDTGARGGFADALRAASGRPAGSRAEAGGRQRTEPDDGAATKGEAAPVVPGLPAAPTAAADPASAAAAILASILNTVTPTAPATGNPSTAADAPALRSAASAPASTAGSGPLAQGGPDLGMTDAIRPTAPQVGGADLDSTPAASLPEVTVLDSAVHFAPVLPRAASREPAVSALAAPAPVAASATESPSVQADLRALIDAEPQPHQNGLPKPATAAALSAPAPSPPLTQPQPTSDPAGTAARAAGTGLEKADVTALSDTRAVTGTARASLGESGRPEGAEVPGPDGSAGPVPGLPAGALPTIAAAIRDEIERAAAPEPAARAPQADPGIRTMPDEPLRVLRIQLKPEDLGTVTVELRLTNGQLETHLRASQPETAALLHRDAAVLTDLLKQANYRAEVTVGPARPSDTGGFSGGSASQGQPGSSDGGARSGQGGDRQRQAAQGPAAGGPGGERGDETTRPRDGGVYL